MDAEHEAYQTGVSIGDDIVLDHEINVGNRLLIYVVGVDGADSIKQVLSQLVRVGTNKRDECGFNRFRLVLLTQRAESVEDAASDAFHSFSRPYLAGKKRLHLD